eukprot:m.216508 g.216508  ORF g.216508 m.216508 type:complete len:1084 (+) comp13806_c1_seq1:31-3282(+)
MGDHGLLDLGFTADSQLTFDGGDFSVSSQFGDGTQDETQNTLNTLNTQDETQNTQEYSQSTQGFTQNEFPDSFSQGLDSFETTHQQQQQKTKTSQDVSHFGDDPFADELGTLSLDETQNTTYADEVENATEEDMERMRQLKEEEELNTLGVYDFAKLPPHSCSYCGIHNTSSVVQCLETGKWFCNSRGNSSSSHIVTHLVRTKRHAVKFHKDSSIGDTVLECYNCDTKNVFSLGFVTATADELVVMLCRQCTQDQGNKEEIWDVKEWKPLIVDRCFVTWLLGTPTHEEETRARQLSSSQMLQLEALWKEDPDATIEDIEQTEEEIEIEEVKPIYMDAYEYQNIFSPLVKLEADYDKQRKEEIRIERVSVRWEDGLNKKVYAYLSLSRENARLMKGDRVALHYDGELRKPWKCTGTLLQVTDIFHEEVLVQLDNRVGIPFECTNNFSLEFLWNSVSFDRMQEAMKSFAIDEQATSQYIYHKLLGRTDLAEPPIDVKIPKVLSAPGLPELNHSQVVAIKTVLSQPLSLIQGPPGTGKTVTSATLVYHLVQIAQERQKGKVLVVAPSNIAVDHLTEKIHKTGVKVVRVTSTSRQDIESSVDHLTLHNQVVGFTGNSAFYKLQQLMNDQGELNERDETAYKKLYRRLEQKFIGAADVITATCSVAGSRRFANFRFSTIVLDEATQATEPESLIPLVHGASQVVLVGDHCQLGPVVMCKKAAEHGLSQSLFERLVIQGIKPARLQVQYRMHPALSEFPSNTFYEGCLQNGVTAAERVMESVNFPWPNPQVPLMFYATTGQEEISASGTSYLNRTEASHVEKIVTFFLKNGVTPDQIGVITPYEGQRAYVVDHVRYAGTERSSLYDAVEIASVDAFQGREKDYMILSCVRSNEHQGIGFLNDPRRLNVAITRARYGLILIGNPKVLSKQPLWNNLLVHFKEADALVEGPLTALRQCSMKFSKPRPLTNKIGYNRYMNQALMDTIFPKSHGPLTNDQFGLNPSMPVRVDTMHYGHEQFANTLMPMGMSFDDETMSQDGFDTFSVTSQESDMFGSQASFINGDDPQFSQEMSQSGMGTQDMMFGSQDFTTY